MKTGHCLLLCLLLASCHNHSQEPTKGNVENREKSMTSIVKTDAEWRKQLSDLQYYVLREQGTERPFTSPLLKVKGKGVFQCAACGNPLFRSMDKFDSGTGWPSFDREIPGHVAYIKDTSFGVVRTEEHCTVCGGHLGHIFDDGPKETTGKRHCINGAAMVFIPD